jgi:hypothetical protein
MPTSPGRQKCRWPAIDVPSGEVLPRSYAFESSCTKKHLQEGMQRLYRTDPRISPGTRRGVGKGYTRRPSRRNGSAHRHHHVNAGRTNKDFTQPTKNELSDNASCSTKFAAYQHTPTRLAVISEVSPWQPLSGWMDREDHQGQGAA